VSDPNHRASIKPRPVQPDDDRFGDDPRPWPPSAVEAEVIDAAYLAAVEAARSEQAARAAYRLRREEWLRAHAPQLLRGEASRESLVRLPGEEELYVELEELDPAGVVCGGRRQQSTVAAFGALIEVIAGASQRDRRDPWVREVTSAIVRERSWKGMGRRSVVEVRQAAGELYHVSAAANRSSIVRYGLDWRRMSIASGVAGSKTPELAADFLGESVHDIGFFARMAKQPSDAWAVRADGLWVENGPSGWLMRGRPIGARRLRLLATDLDPSMDVKAVLPPIGRR
jgi:hypothetical protein